MAETLRRVLQRKRAFLNKFLSDVTDKQLGSLRQLDLITDDSLLYLMKIGKTKKLMDHITLGEAGQPEEFLEFLKQEYVWIYDEVKSEVKAETFDLELDEVEVEEAAALIHRHFGRSRRFGERDKKTMAALVATRSQVAKEIWKYRLAAITQVLDEVKARLKIKEDAIRSTDDVIKGFLRHHQLELHDFSHGLKSTSQTLLETGGTSSHEDLFTIFLKRVNFLVDRFRKALFENQSLWNQKKECMKILDCHQLKTPLDSMLSDSLKKLSDEQRSNTNIIRSLENRNQLLEKDIKKRDGQIALLQVEVERLKQEMERQPDVVLPPIDGGSSPVAPRSPNIKDRRVVPAKRAATSEKLVKTKVTTGRHCVLNRT